MRFNVMADFRCHPGHTSTGTLTRHGRACPGHPRLTCCQFRKTWMPATSAGMTKERRARAWRRWGGAFQQLW